jgi:hypothetical protein
MKTLLRSNLSELLDNKSKNRYQHILITVLDWKLDWKMVLALTAGVLAIIRAMK